MSCCKNKYKKGGCQTDTERGCRYCNCGEESIALPIEGYYKLPETDWLGDMPDVFPSDIFEVRFKNTRKSFFRNVNALPLQTGDIVAVEASPGHDIGIVSLTGDMVRKQMKRMNFNPMNGEYKKIYRKAKSYDIEKWQEAIAMEHSTMIKSRQITADLGLNMKIGDVEYQGDRIKAIFYYIADERVDFRTLIRVLAEHFSIRVEMKQIGARQEAGRIGGLGSCGRQLCCASWMSSFVSVTTNAARSQEVSLNPQKLAGQCGKLKCCMVYELDSYLDARKSFPRIHQPLRALDGDYFHVKNDILAGTMIFSNSPHSLTGLTILPIGRVRDIIDLNKKGHKVDNLIEVEKVTKPKSSEHSFINQFEEDSISRFDSKQRNADKNRRRNNNNREGRIRTNGNGNSNANGAEKVSEPTVEKVDNKSENRLESRPKTGQDGGNSRNNRNRNNRNRSQRNSDTPLKPTTGGDGQSSGKETVKRTENK